MLSGAGRRVLRWLETELMDARDTVAFVAEVGAAAYGNGRRDSFRSGGREGAGLAGGIWASLTRSPLVVVLNPAFENRLRDDPEFTGKIDRFLSGRVQSSYFAVTGAIGDVGFGRAARQWGPVLFDGLQLSPSAYATDEVWAAMRLGRFELTTIAQRLDDQQADSVSQNVPISRYFFAHRLALRAGRGVWLAFTETGVYGGPGRGFEPAFHAPLNPALLSEFNEKRQANILWGTEIQAKLGSRLTLQAQAVIDDLQIDDSTLAERRPWSGGFSVVTTAALVPLPVHASLGYTRVQSLTYRNSFAPFEVYAVAGIGIARNFSDYDQILLRIESLPSPCCVLAMDVSYLRQGSGDFRQPFPSDSALAAPGQGFLVRPVRSGMAARVTTSFEIVRGVRASGKIGFDGAAPNATRTIASLAGHIRLDILGRKLGGVWEALEQNWGGPAH